MSDVDVTSQIVIARPVEEVAAYSANPDNAPTWYEFAPGKRLVMRTSEGPFPMETIYTWDSTSDGKTRMTLRNHGSPAGFSKLMSPFMSFAMRRANRKDLAQLRELLEQGQPRPAKAPEHAV